MDTTARAFAPTTAAEPTFAATGLRRNRRDRLTLQPADFVDPRYADLADQCLALALTTEDRSEEDGLDPLERTTCRNHRRWLHDCVSSPLHVIVVTGTRWCRTCQCALNVAIDRTCRASLAAACDH